MPESRLRALPQRGMDDRDHNPAWAHSVFVDTRESVRPEALRDGVEGLAFELNGTRHASMPSCSRTGAREATARASFDDSTARPRRASCLEATSKDKEENDET